MDFTVGLLQCRNNLYPPQHTPEWSTTHKPTNVRECKALGLSTVYTDIKKRKGNTVEQRPIVCSYTPSQHISNEVGPLLILSQPSPKGMVSQSTHCFISPSGLTSNTQVSQHSFKPKSVFSTQQQCMFECHCKKSQP